MLLGMLIAIGLLWIVLKIMLAVIELPFKILGFLFSLPMSLFFWVVFIVVLFALT